MPTTRDQEGGAERDSMDASPPEIGAVVQRNIRLLTDVRRREEARKTLANRVADRITTMAGSMTFVVVHVVWIGGWIAANVGLIPDVEPWDPFPSVMLAVIVSVEAIFLSTFILIRQNRMQQLADRRAELDVQVSLLTEHELTRAIRLLDAIAQRLGVPQLPEPELEEIKRDVEPEKVIEEIQRAEDDLSRKGRT
jgi:uncharacterized membrane protein